MALEKLKNDKKFKYLKKIANFVKIAGTRDRY